MSKRPAVQFYVSDFLTGTTFFSNEETGLYIRLLCLQVEHGCIPDDVEQFVKLYGKGSRKAWVKVREKFVVGDAPGTLVNERMLKAMEDRAAFIKRQTERGHLSAATRTNHGSTKDRSTKTGSTTVQPITVEPLGDGDGEISSSGKGTRTRNAYPPDLSEAFALFGSKGSKHAAAKFWAKMTEQERTACLKAIPAEVAGTHPDNTFPSRRHFSTYLSQRGWEEDPKPPLKKEVGWRKDQTGRWVAPSGRTQAELDEARSAIIKKLGIVTEADYRREDPELHEYIYQKCA